MPPLKDTIGFTDKGPAIASPDEEKRLREFVNLKLAARATKSSVMKQTIPSSISVALFSPPSRKRPVSFPTTSAPSTRPFTTTLPISSTTTPPPSSLPEPSSWSATVSGACFPSRPIKMNSNPPS